MDIATIIIAFLMGAAVTSILSFLIGYIKELTTNKDDDIKVIVERGGHTKVMFNPTNEEINQLLKVLKGDNPSHSPTNQ